MGFEASRSEIQAEKRRQYGLAHDLRRRKEKMTRPACLVNFPYHPRAEALAV